MVAEYNQIFIEKKEGWALIVWFYWNIKLDERGKSAIESVYSQPSCKGGHSCAGRNLMNQSYEIPVLPSANRNDRF
jgi:hypothetical protein